MAMLNNQRVLSDYQILLTTPSHSQLHLTACEAAIMEHGDVDAVVLTKESRSPWGDGWPTANSMSTHSEKFLRNSSRQSQKLKPVLKNAVLLQKQPPPGWTIPSHLWGQIPCRHGKGHLHFLVPGGVVIPGSSKAAAWWSCFFFGRRETSQTKKTDHDHLYLYIIIPSISSYHHDQ